MRLPNAERARVDFARVDLEKVRDYCLSLEHPTGRHKAGVFAASLGLTAEQADVLRDALLAAALTHDVLPIERDRYGQRYLQDFTMDTAGGRAVVRSSWIVRVDEDFARLTSCYVL